MIRSHHLVVLALLAGCHDGSLPPLPPSGPSPMPRGYVPASYQQPAAHPIDAIGQALTAWGMTLQLPALQQLPNPWPPLPTPAEWASWWPFPWSPPAQPPAVGSWPAAWTAFEDAVLDETNGWRARGAVCGGQPLSPAAALAPHPQLRHAARGHSSDMARRNYFEHRSPEGTSPMQRAEAAGYRGGFVGENIAAGQRTPREVVQAWIDSPGHCLNVMDPRYRFLGVGFVHEDGDTYRDYWTQNFGG
jgi:uncharacterized protein YkwD